MSAGDALDLFRSPQAGYFGRRRRHPRGARVPVTIVTGFLGAGKTTLLRRFLSTPDGHGTAVIVNEFGEAGIDDALLRASADATVLIGNGCLCCNIRSDLETALHRLIAERARGLVPSFDRIVIETSGLADPGPILRTFATDRALAGEFHVEVILAVVDAATGAATLERHSEARRQVMFADRVIISKSDLVSLATTQALTERLRVLNPRAAIAIAAEGAVTPQHLIEAPTPSAGRNVFVAEAMHGDGIGSFVLTMDAPLPWPAFAQTMAALTALRGPDLLRVKGFLDTAGCRGPVVVQFVQHLAHPPVELAAWPDGARGTRIVFITRGVSERDVRSLLAAICTLAPTP